MSKTTAAAAATADAAPTPVKRFGAVLRDAWRARESGVLWNEHEVVAAAGTPVERVLEADYWANIASYFKPGDNIIIMPEDGAWRAELLVWGVGPSWAQVAVKKPFAKRPDFGAAPGAAADAFEVEFAGPIKKHRVIRKTDRAELKTGFDSPEAARRWIDDYRKALK